MHISPMSKYIALHDQWPNFLLLSIYLSACIALSPECWVSGYFGFRSNYQTSIRLFFSCVRSIKVLLWQKDLPVISSLPREHSGRESFHVPMKLPTRVVFIDLFAVARFWTTRLGGAGVCDGRSPTPWQQQVLNVVLLIISPVF